MSVARTLRIAEIAISVFDGPFGSNLKSVDYTDSGTRVVRLENIGHRRFITEKETFISNEKAATLARHLLLPGDVLFSSFVDDAVRVCLLPAGLPTAAINKADCFCVRVNPAVAMPEFVALRLASRETYEAMRDLVHGATRPRVGLEALKNYRIKVPTLAEQRRIMARIEALFARTRRARTDLERITALSEKYLAATLRKSFEGQLTESWRSESQATGMQHRSSGLKGPYELPSSWSWQYLPALGELARGKSRHRPRNAAFLYGGPYPFIQTGDVRAAQGRLRTYEQTYSEAGLAQSKLWLRDTVCITIAANIAETAILDIEACFPDSVVGFKADQQSCLPEFIEYFIRTAKADLAAFAPATAQKNINLETLEAVLVPTPSLAEQRESVRLLSRSELTADACRREATRALALLDRLEQSILTRAFRGELVPQNPAADLQARTPAVEAVASASPRRGRRAAA